MKLGAYSKNRVMGTFAHWNVPKDFADPMYNYLVHGYNPGSCFTSVLANDFAGAIARSHPANTVESFKALAGWMRDTVPADAYGTYKAVNDWCYLKDNERRVILENENLIYTKEEEMILILSGEPVTETVLY